MANKGITIDFRGNPAPLKDAINSIRREAKTLDNELGYINKSLKFNPTSVKMWTQKQKVLNEQVDSTKKRLEELKGIEKQLQAQNLDRNSEQFREVEREIVKANNQLKQFRKELTKVGSAKLNALSEGFKQLGSKMSAVGKTLSTKVTLPLSLLGGAAAKGFAEVDKIMVLTNSTMGNTEEQAKLLNDAMKEAAANSTYGMNDAAQSMLNFARAGLTAEQSASALAPAMNLAAGEGGDLDTVSAGLVATINGFQGSFDEASRYADVFANACNNSALDVNSLSEAMSIAAPIFKTAGYSVEDAALYMGVMANNGIDANKAATSLKTGMARLLSPTEDAADWMATLGINMTNADGTMKDTITIQKELHDAFSTLSEAQQIQAASSIFGKNQMAPWLALINTAPEDVNALSTSLMAEGTASQMASDMMSGFGGAIEKLKSSIDVASVSLGEALAPTIEKVVGWIQKAVDWFNSLDDKTKTMIATAGIVVAAIGPVMTILGGLFTTIGTVIGGISKFIGVAKLVVSVLGGPVSLAIAGAIAIGVALWRNWDTIKEKATQLKDWVVGKWTALKDSVVGAVTSLKESVLAHWDALKSGISTIASAILSVLTNPFETALTVIKTVIDKIKGLFDGWDFSLPHINLPHFSISPPDWRIGDLLKGSIPRLGIEWYDKGGIFDSPSVIGVGEKRPEFVGALDDLRKIVREESAPTITINVTAPQGMDVNELARVIEQKMIQSVKRQSLAW